MEQQQNVATLRLVEGISIDPACLAILRQTGTPGQSDRMIGEALEDVALGLTRVARAYREDRFADISTESIAIGDLCKRIGLERLARVAYTVSALAKGSDPVALSANLARLMRLGNDTLRAIWDLQDQIV